ncbi:hypothetical protein Bbelb_337500 [Branchiostoma belcheri]|nr:hypothetical protein Bbelb_337500 [Branchiostoma belcheri]
MLREAFPSQRREGFCTVCGAHVQLDASLQYCFKVLGVSAKVLVLWKGKELLKTTEVSMFSMVSHASNQPPKHQTDFEIHYVFKTYLTFFCTEALPYFVSTKLVNILGRDIWYFIHSH